MLFSKVYAPTLREVPAEAEIQSHKLLLRAGFIRRAAGGVYTYLPLGWKVLRKIEQIVREEMDAKGCQELLMPIIQPEEIWKETGRWDVYGDEMWRLKDRHGRGFCLGPTHEEMITTLVRQDVRSYRQLPLRFYQIQNKYRDEIRPRFGLMRGREFIMKDMYSFDRDEAGLEKAYWDMYEAYGRIFSRCGLEFRPVEADSGAIGGSGSHEFMALADSGEADVVFCDTCDFAANTEKAELLPLIPMSSEEKALEEVATPEQKTIAEISAFLGVAPEATIKSMMLSTDQGPVMVLLRGDHELNLIKVQNALGCTQVDIMNDSEAKELELATGYLGPIGLKDTVRVLADHTVMKMNNAVVGANKEGIHLRNFSPMRDFTPTIIGDYRMIREGDPCPRCAGKVQTARGIEVGQVFKLYTKYSESLGCTFLDENGRDKPMVMGCYGIGVSRTMAAAVEQYNDENGIIWPVSLAPFDALVVPVSMKDEEQQRIAFEIYHALKAQKLDVCLDDRNERPGVKFKDADLIGFPLRVVVGGKAIEEGVVEIKVRKTGEVKICPLADVTTEVQAILLSLA